MKAQHLSVFLFLLAPLAAVAAEDDRALSEQIARGQYMVNLLACGRCHTEGLLTGNQASGPYLAGSRIGVAYTAYSEDDSNPGVVFPGNLTPDEKTGLGTWSEPEIIRAMTAGVVKGGHEHLTVMPWANYGALTDQDLVAVARFLKSLSPVERTIPGAIAEGGEISQPYVRFGVYQFHPHRKMDDAVEGYTLPRPGD